MSMAYCVWSMMGPRHTFSTGMGRSYCSDALFSRSSNSHFGMIAWNSDGYTNWNDKSWASKRCQCWSILRASHFQSRFFPCFSKRWLISAPSNLSRFCTYILHHTSSSGDNILILNPRNSASMARSNHSSSTRQILFTVSNMISRKYSPLNTFASQRTSVSSVRYPFEAKNLRILGN